MDENRNQNQIIRKDARSCFVESLSDAFEIGKVHLAFATYDLTRPAGQRQTNNIHIYIAVDEFLDLCRKIECGELRYMLQNKKQNKDIDSPVSVPRRYICRKIGKIWSFQEGRDEPVHNSEAHMRNKTDFCLSQTADRDKLMPKGLSFRSSETNPKTMFPSL